MSRRRLRHDFRFPVLLVVALVLGACVNPFKPADPEPPDASGVLEDFSWPDSVLDTMERALENRSPNGASAYIRAFADSQILGDRAFRAFQDGAVKSNWEGSTRTAPEPWNLTLEQNVHSYLSGLRPTLAYDWVWGPDNDSPVNEDPSAADTVLYHKKYELFATDGVTDVRIAVGYADLSFQKREGRWSIFRWVDRVDPTVGVLPINTDDRTMTWRRLESLAN